MLRNGPRACKFQVGVPTLSKTIALFGAIAVPLHAQSADSIALDSTTQRRAPVTIGVSAPVRSIGSVRLSLDASDLRDGARPRTLSELLQARLPGVSVLRTGGDPSDGSRVRVRGTTSLTGDAAPVVIIDGIPVNTPEALGSTLSMNPTSRFDDFDPEEIEQIDVLPGPAATTLFGGGASNGAIVITTKRGVSGRPQWRGWLHGALSSEPTAYPANYHQNGTSPSTGNAVASCDVVAIANRQCDPTTLDVWNPLEAASPFRTGRYGAGGVSVAGGPFGIKAYASALGRAESGVLDDSRASRVNGRVNVERELFGQLTVAGSVGYVDRRATTRTDNVVERGLVGTALDDADRGYLAPLDAPTIDRRGDRLSRSARVEWRALSWLRVHGTAGRDEITQRDFTLVPFFPPGSAPPLPSTTRHWLASSIAHGTAEAEHRPSASVVLRTLVSYEESSRRSVEEEFSTGSGSVSSRWNSIRSWMVQERVGIRDRLFVNLGARRIAAERSDNRGRWHPSVDVAWDVGRLPSGGTLRLRGAYAVGLQPRDTNSVFFFVPLPPSGALPPPIEPEQPRETEVGFDANLGTRVALNATVFAQQTPKLIALTLAPPTTGGSTLAATLGKMSNRGVELVARFRLVDRPATHWGATITLGTLRNRVSGLNGVPPAIFTGPGVRDEQPFGVFVIPRITFIDTNGDNLPSPFEITLSDYRPTGTAVPTREVSLRSQLELPRLGLVLGTALDHRGGHRALNVFDIYQCAVRNCRQLQDPSVALIDKINAVVVSYLSTRSPYLESASYTRVGEVVLEWTPSARFGRAIVNGVTISIEGRNLATWTRFHGPDPEVATASARQGFPAVQGMPAMPRTIGVRVELAAR